MTTRSGAFLQAEMNCELGMPDDEDAMITSGRAPSSISAMSGVLTSGFSGAFWSRSGVSYPDVAYWELRNPCLLDEVDVCVVLL